MRTTSMHRTTTIAILAGLLGVLPAGAAQIDVTTLADTRVVDGVCSLREALSNANQDNDTSGGDCQAGSGADKISLPPGTISLTIPNIGGSEDFNGRGDLDVLDDVFLIGTPGAQSTIDATGINDRVLDLPASGVELQMSDVTLQGGLSSSGGGLRVNGGSTADLFRCDLIQNDATLFGGGIINTGGTLILNQVYLGSNTATNTGGGIHTTNGVTIVNSLLEDNQSASGGGIYVAGGNVVSTNTEYDNNIATGSGGGVLGANAGATYTFNGGVFRLNTASQGAAAQFNGVWTMDGMVVADNTASSGGTIRSRSNGTVENTIFIRNSGGTGGAIDHEVGDLEIEDSTFTDNQASSGGAIFADDRLSVRGSLIDSNNATAGSGGAIYCTDWLTVLRTTIDANTATVNGGGIYADTWAASVSYSTVRDNVSQGAGGGVYVTATGIIDFSQATVSGNLAGDNGGGVWAGGDVDFNYATIADNRANNPGPSGGGVFLAGGAIEIKNSILWDNSPQSCGGDGTGTVSSAGYNSADDACPLGGPGDVQNETFLDMQPLADNGGPTWTHALGLNSVARDTAAPGCIGLSGGAALNDQRQEPRPRDGDGIGGSQCDRGAYEALNPFASQPLPVPDGSFGPPMRASRNDAVSGTVNISWDSLNCTSSDYHVLYGDLAQVDLWIPTGSVCGLGQTGSATAMPLPAGNLWFIVVSNDFGDTEGSWGQTSLGERGGAVASGECGMVFRDNTGVCP